MSSLESNSLAMDRWADKCSHIYDDVGTQKGTFPSLHYMHGSESNTCTYNV